MATSLVLTKQALISKLKATVAVTSLLPGGAVEVREAEWNGTNFHYPCVRVHVDEYKRNTPGSACLLFDVIATIYIMADDASSLKTDQIATAIYDLFDTKSYSDLTNTTKFIGIKAKQFGASWNDIGGTWQSSVILTFQVS